MRTIADARAMGVTVLPPDVNESDTDFKVVYTHPGGGRPSKRAEKVRGPARPADTLRARGRTRARGRGARGGVRGARGRAAERPLRPVVARRRQARQQGRLRGARVLQRLRLHARSARRHAREGVRLRRRGARAVPRGQPRSGSGADDPLRRLRRSPLGGLRLALGRRLPRAEPWDRREMLVRERTALGFYVSGHPLESATPRAKRASWSGPSRPSRPARPPTTGRS